MIAAARDLEILNPGDRSGHGMVARFRAAQGIPIYAIGVAQSWKSPTGPTWCYLFDADGLTLVDTGKFAALDNLAAGIEATGYHLRDIERIIITHGHGDHDGNAYPVQQLSGAELWCHEVYAHTLDIDPYAPPLGPLQQAAAATPRDAPPQSEELHQAYHRTRPQLRVTQAVSDGQTWGPLTFLYTPGHAMDELCILLDGVMFSGDHILPVITPHPSCRAYFEHFRPHLPPAYQGENHYFGLRAYLESVKKVAALGGDFLVLPAHRLYHRNQWQLRGRERAGEIVRHHLGRLGRIARLAQAPESLLNLTRRLFRPPLLQGGGLYQGLTELFSHLEFLEETGDIEYIGEEAVQWRGTSHFRQVVRRLAPSSRLPERP